MVNYLNNIRDLVDLANKRIKERTPPRKRGRGRPPTDPANVAKTLLLQTYLESSNRMTEGFLILFREKLGINSHFSYKTIERGYDQERVNEVLDEIVVITNESVEGKEETCSFDGTDFSSSNQANHADKWQKQNSKKKHKKSKSASSVGSGRADDSFPKLNSTGEEKVLIYCHGRRGSI